MRDKFVNILLIAITIISVLFYRTCNKKDELDARIKSYQAANDGLNQNINKLGQQVTTTQLIVSDYGDIKHKLRLSDSTVKKLQQIIDKHTLSATVLNTTTRDKGVSQTNVLHSEIVIHHDTIFVYPTYKSKWKEKWSEGEIIATKDSITRNVMFLNEYDIKQSYQRSGSGMSKYFKQRVPMIQVVNINPNTITTDLKSYSLQPDKRPKIRAFMIGGFICAAIIYGIAHLK